MTAAAAAVSLLAGGASAAELTGLWRTAGPDGGVIRLEPCGGWVCGRVETSKQLAAVPGQKDVLNKDPTLRGRPVKGLLMLKVRPLAAARWGEGWIYNPKDGGTYKASIELAEAGKLKLQGCVAPLLCKTEVWTQLK
jgi:uncharacterized protein (DUF2147 family)